MPWNKGKKGIYSKETRLKMSLAKKGKPSWNKGKKLSESHCNNLSSSHLGFKRPEEDKIKISETLKEKYKNGSRISYSKGKKQSIETIKKRSLSLPHGKNHHWWKGGVTKGNRKERSSLEIKLWRKSVFERDNFTCQKTGKRGGKLVAHHINNFSEFKELRTSIENGVTLSRESHIKFHKIYGIANNTRDQLEEFLIKNYE